jgi:hypothetical protein
MGRVLLESHGLPPSPTFKRWVAGQGRSEGLPRRMQQEAPPGLRAAAPGLRHSPHPAAWSSSLLEFAEKSIIQCYSSSSLLGIAAAQEVGGREAKRLGLVLALRDEVPSQLYSLVGAVRKVQLPEISERIHPHKPHAPPSEKSFWARPPRWTWLPKQSSKQISRLYKLRPQKARGF